jgi:hypothetical protein
MIDNALNRTSSQLGVGAQAEERIEEKVSCENVAYAACVDIEVPQRINSKELEGAVARRRRRETSG